MEGFFGDILKTIIAVMLALALLTLLIFFYHLQSLAHYQHDVNSILEKNSSSIPFKDQYNNDSKNKTAFKLYHLDDQYGWIFTIKENPSDKPHKSFNYGDYEPYTIQAHIPLSFIKFQNTDYIPKNNNKNGIHNGIFDRSDSDFIYSTKMNGQATCELHVDHDDNTNNDNSNNSNKTNNQNKNGSKKQNNNNSKRH